MAKSHDTTVAKMVWKRGDGWVIFNPPRSHPSYDEWMKMKQKLQEKENTINETDRVD
jgi:hypothetical protein